MTYSLQELKKVNYRILTSFTSGEFIYIIFPSLLEFTVACQRIAICILFDFLLFEELRLISFVIIPDVSIIP